MPATSVLQLPTNKGGKKCLTTRTRVCEGRLRLPAHCAGEFHRRWVQKYYIASSPEEAGDSLVLLSIDQYACIKCLLRILQIELLFKPKGRIEAIFKHGCHPRVNAI